MGRSEENVIGNNRDRSPERQEPPPVEFNREIQGHNPHSQHGHMLSENGERQVKDDSEAPSCLQYAQQSHPGTVRCFSLQRHGVL